MNAVLAAPGTALSARGLGKRYRSSWALADLDLDLPPGSVTALVGHNGAGKTTLLRILAGLVTPTTGSIGRTEARAFAFVSQDKPLFPWPVRDLLEFGARMHTHWDQPLVLEWLDTLGLPLDRNCGKLSGGQRAQVALGLALGSRPDVLLLDEPMASLDPLARAELTRALLGAVAQTGVTVLLSTHQTGDLQALADRLLLLAGGRCVLAGEVDELMAGYVELEGPGPELPVAADAVVVRAGDGQRLRATVAAAAALPALLHPGWITRPVTFEQLVLDHLLASRKQAA